MYERFMLNLTVCPCSGVMFMHLHITFKHLLSKTAWLIKAKFYDGPPLEGGAEAYISGLGHEPGSLLN